MGSIFLKINVGVTQYIFESRTSSLKLLLKLSIQAFCVGFPGCVKQKARKSL
jgi:hypothetical protein